MAVPLRRWTRAASVLRALSLAHFASTAAGPPPPEQRHQDAGPSHPTHANPGEHAAGSPRWLFGCRWYPLARRVGGGCPLVASWFRAAVRCHAVEVSLQRHLETLLPPLWLLLPAL